MSVGHYENFPVASLLLPARLRRPVAVIYAFARSADDFADEGDDPPGVRLERLEAYRAELRRIAAQAAPRTSLFDDVARIVSEHRLPGYPNAPTLKEAGFDVPVVPQVRGVVAPPGIPRENIEYWQDLFFRLSQTASWKKYIADNQFEDGYQGSAELSKFMDSFSDRMRGREGPAPAFTVPVGTSNRPR